MVEFPAGPVPRRDFLKGVAAGAAALSLAGPLSRAVFAEGETPAPAMKRRPLGKTGIETSVVAWGAGALGPGRAAMLKAAFDRGVTTFDTAWGYGGGKSEEGLGEFVAALGEDRKRICIVTKASGFRPPAGAAKEVYAAFRGEVDKCLARLRTDYLDVLFWPHGASRPEDLKDERMREALGRLKEEKVIRAIGTSTHSNYAETALAAIEDGLYGVVMLVANVSTQSVKDDEAPAAPGAKGRPILDTKKVLKAAAEKQVGIIAMKAAKDGFLAPDADEVLAKHFPADSPLSRHQKLYRFMLDQTGISAVTVGIADVKHLKEAVEIGCL